MSETWTGLIISKIALAYTNHAIITLIVGLILICVLTLIIMQVAYSIEGHIHDIALWTGIGAGVVLLFFFFVTKVILKW